MLNHCYIYRCAAKADMYLYLAKENDFEILDEDLLNKLGDLTFAMTLKLEKDTKLAKKNNQMNLVKSLRVFAPLHETFSVPVYADGKGFHHALPGI